MKHEYRSGTAKRFTQLYMQKLKEQNKIIVYSTIEIMRLV